MFNPEEPVVVSRDIDVTQVPYGYPMHLATGTKVRVVGLAGNVLEVEPVKMASVV